MRDSSGARRSGHGEDCVQHFVQHSGRNVGGDFEGFAAGYARFAKSHCCWFMLGVAWFTQSAYQNRGRIGTLLRIERAGSRLAPVLSGALTKVGEFPTIARRFLHTDHLMRRRSVVAACAHHWRRGENSRRPGGGTVRVFPRTNDATLTGRSEDRPAARSAQSKNGSGITQTAPEGQRRRRSERVERRSSRIRQSRSVPRVPPARGPPW